MGARVRQRHASTKRLAYRVHAAEVASVGGIGISELSRDSHGNKP